MLLQEGKNSSAIERHQRLNQVIAVDSGVMIGRCKFAERSCPERVFVTEFPIVLGCDPLQLRVSLRGEYRLQDVRQLGGTAQEQFEHSLSVHSNWFRGQLVFWPKRRHRLGSIARHPERLLRFQTPE